MADILGGEQLNMPQVLVPYIKALRRAGHQLSRRNAGGKDRYSMASDR